MPAFNRFRSFEALDSCHQQIQSNLDQLAILSEQLIAGNLDADARKQAESIELFFSTVARGHHAMEEDEVFPALLICDIAETVAKVRDLIEDHFWIEKYWLDLSPVLKDIAQGTQGTDTTKLAKTVKLFHDLCSYHIECEEMMIYPQAKAMMNSIQAHDATD